MQRGRTGAFSGALVLLAVALAGLNLPTPALAQAPGPELFAQEPQTPMELWSAVDYLVRTGQSKKAVPYLEKFLKGQTDDATLVAIRDNYGAGSILRLADEPATSKYAQPLVERLTAAGRRFATQPERIAKAVDGLTGSEEEQAYAVARLREAGPYAVPPLIEALQHTESTPEKRALLVRNIGRLDRTAVPPLLAVLDSSDPQLAADAATALGSIGDPRAVPFLTYAASAAKFPPAVREAAQAAIGRLTGRSFVVQPHSPAQVLTEAAWSFHRHQVEFPGDPVAVWVWDKDHKVPVPRPMKRGDAEGYFGLLLANEAHLLQPLDLGAHTAAVSLALEKAIDRVGFNAFPAQDQSTFASAVAAGPAVLAEVLRKAIADGKDELAAAAATALGQVTDRALLSSTGHPHPLVEALSNPGARVQFAAAKALIELAPTQPFPGSSRVVPTLARFATAQRPPRAVVIDGNSNRGSQLSGSLKALGYETVLETSGDQGFRAAAESADVELVLVSHAQAHGAWNLIDILTNLKSDARTANLPVYIYGPFNLERDRSSLLAMLASFPGVRFLVQPVSPAILETLLGGRPAKLTAAERAGYASEAASLLARIVGQPRSPYAADLSASEPELTIALNQPDTSVSASKALGDVPNPDAQQSLADVVLDPSRPVDFRRTCASELARSIQRFGALVSAGQEAQLAAEARTEADPQFRTALGTVIAALRAQSPAPPARPVQNTRPPAASVPATSDPPANHQP
jgi:HEAT repeat protein